MGKEMDSYLFQEHLYEMKDKQPYPGFELGSPIPFLIIIVMFNMLPNEVLCRHILL